MRAMAMGRKETEFDFTFESGMSGISGMIGVVGKVALLRQRKLFMGNEESGSGMRGAGRCAPDGSRFFYGDCAQAEF